MGEKRTSSKTESGLVELTGDTLDVTSTATFRGIVNAATINTTNFSASGVTAQTGFFTPGIVNATGTISAGAVTVTNAMTSGSVATGPLTANSINAGQVSVTGDLGASNLYAETGVVSVQNVVASNAINARTVSTTQTITATGTVTGGSLTTTGSMTSGSVATGGLTATTINVGSLSTPATASVYLGRYVQTGVYGGGAAKVFIPFPQPYPLTIPINRITVTLSVIRGNLLAATADDVVVYSHGVNNISALGFYVLKTFYNFSTNTGGLDVNSGFYWIASAGGLDT